MDPPVNTAPAVAGTDQATAALGPPSTVTPVTFIATALGNLGLINGQNGNSGNSPAVAAQMPSTLATFAQVEADIANVLAEFATAGSTGDFAGDVNLLQQVDSRLKAVTTAENTLFGSDPNWLDSNQSDTLQQWLTAFFGYAQDSSDGAESITAAERTQLLATTLPSTVTTAEANEFLDRWNRTVQYWGQGIYTASQVPNGQSTDFLDVSALRSVFDAAQTAEQQSQVNGYSDPLAETTAATATVQNDLTQQGTCATVKLQIDQTATMTRSAFSGTLAVTNTEAAGSLTNVAMSINITDDQGNPANGVFFISSPTYSGAFSVVNGSATLPNNATGTISFTFIPDDSAASVPTIYHIGGTFSFTDPSGVNVSNPLGAAAIMVYPQAQLQLNYFLQRDVIGQDPFSSQPIPSEPAVLGLLVTNTGKGTANNFSITTAQPQIIQNDKGLLDNFQIIGTQVGSQQVTPSLTVDLGTIQPGQTGDADFLLLSSLQGIFDHFTATFTHSDALGGLATSLIQSVQTHTLIHAGNFNYANSTGAIDYLAEDNANPANLPDTIYFSDGTKAAVNIATSAASAPAGTDAYTVTANVTSGWDYILLPDPGAGYTLSKVVRSDGTVITVSDQAWTTDRTFNAAGNSSVDHELHILDFDSTGSYTVYYVPSAPTSIVNLLPAVEPTPTFTLTWTGSPGSSGAAIASYSIYVSDNGGAYTAFLTNTTQTSTTFTGVAGHTYSFYSVATDTAGNVQPTPAGAQATTQIVAAVDVSVAVTADAGTVNAGDPVGFTVTLTNLGTATATGVSLNDVLPPGLGNDLSWVIDPNVGNPSDFQISSGTLSLNGLSSLDAQQSISVHVTAVATALDVNSSSLTGTLNDSALVTAANEPTADQNQQASATITVNAPAVTALVAANQSPIAAGQTAGFTITLTNGGPGVAHGVTLSDTLPKGLGNDITWQIASNPSGLFVLTENVLSLQSSTSLTAGQSITVVVTGVTSGADIDPQTLMGTLLDTATVNANNELAADQNQQSSASITITGVSPVRFQITPSVTTIVAGTAFNITVTALNAANGTATNYTGTIHFTTSSTKYVLPANYTFTAADAGTHTFSIKLETAGVQSVTATDINKASMTGQTSISTEFAITTSASGPEGITVGPDGNLWFVETTASKIGMSTPAGSMTEFALPAGSQPVSIVKGPDGNLWFTEEGTNKIGRMTTAGVLAEFTVPTAASQPYGIAVGSDGNLWFTELSGNKIGKITPTGVFKEFALPAGSAPEGITAGP
ncbi:MAG TPA: hypothetical protein VFA18_10365, partial [Gemmataceae bacterium]|nr:hypothetical protein [Gemmataceae bacterium]